VAIIYSSITLIVPAYKLMIIKTRPLDTFLADRDHFKSHNPFCLRISIKLGTSIVISSGEVDFYMQRWVS